MREEEREREGGRGGGREGEGGRDEGRKGRGKEGGKEEKGREEGREGRGREEEREGEGGRAGEEWEGGKRWLKVRPNQEGLYHPSKTSLVTRPHPLNKGGVWPGDEAVARHDVEGDDE